MASAGASANRLSAISQNLVSSSQTAEQAVLEFVRHYPAGRQDVSALSRELGEVRMTAGLLQRNDEESDGQRSNSVAPNLRPSIVGVARSTLALIDQVAETLRQPDRSRDGWLQDIAETLSKMTRRAELSRMALNVGLDAIILLYKLRKLTLRSANTPPAPNHSDLPPYETTQIIQEVLTIRTRILDVNDGDDAQAHGETTALMELLDSIQAYIEQTSSSLLIPSAPGDPGTSSGPSGRSDAGSERSDAPPPPPPPAIDLVHVTHPAPDTIVLRHVTKMDAGHSEILQLHFFKRNSNLLVAVASVESAIKTYDIKGNNVPFPGQMWGIHMAFCSEAPLWAYLGDAEREARIVGPEYHNRDDFYVKRPATHMYNHITGAKLHTMNSVYAKPLAFSNLGSHFAVSKPGGRMMVMHASGYSAPSKHVISCFHTDDVTHAVFTPDAHGLVTISRDGTIRMIDPNTGESLAKLDVDTWKQPQFLGMTPDGNVIVSIWGDTVYRWDYNTGSLDTYVLHTRRQRDGRPIAISADCRFLACSTHDGVDVSDLHSGRLLHTLRFQGGYATAAAFSPDGKYLALGKSAGGLLRVTKATVDIWELVF